jgi:hypothetical protein
VAWAGLNARPGHAGRGSKCPCPARQPEAHGRALAALARSAGPECRARSKSQMTDLSQLNTAGNNESSSKADVTPAKRCRPAFSSPDDVPTAVEALAEPTTRAFLYSGAVEFGPPGASRTLGDDGRIGFASAANLTPSRTPAAAGRCGSESLRIASAAPPPRPIGRGRTLSG